MCIAGAPVVHGDIEEPGRTKCLHPRRHLLDMSSKRFLALVEAANDLGPGKRSVVLQSQGMWSDAKIGVNRQRVQHLNAIAALEGKLQNPTALPVGKRLNLF